MHHFLRKFSFLWRDFFDGIPLRALESAGRAPIGTAEEPALLAAPDCDGAAVGAAHLYGLLIWGNLPATRDASGHTDQPRYKIGSIFKD